MGWLQKNIDRVCKDREIFSELLVQKNPFLTEYANRFCIAYYLEKLDQKLTSIQQTPLTKQIFALTKHSIKIKDLINSLVKQLPHLMPEKIRHVIQILIQEQFLLFTLLPSLISSSPFEDFLKKIPPSYFNFFSKIHHEILNYSSSKVGEGEEMFFQINQQMRDLAESASYLQVDAAAPHAHITLPKRILEEVAEGVELLWLIESDKPSRLSDYYNKFLSKYGRHRLVQLYDLLDEVRGLGMPEIGILSADGKSSKKPDSPFKEWLKMLFIIPCGKRNKKLKLTKSLFQSGTKTQIFRKHLLR